MGFALTPAMLAQIVPRPSRGSVLSIHTALIALAGILAPAVVGQLVQRHGMIMWLRSGIHDQRHAADEWPA
ncbi:hypothetical protein ACU4GD_42410 [Cupriavidus basilensis]